MPCHDRHRSPASPARSRRPARRLLRRPRVLLRGLRRRRAVPCSYDPTEPVDRPSSRPRRSPRPARSLPARGSSRILRRRCYAMAPPSLAVLAAAALALARRRSDRRGPRAPLRGCGCRPADRRRRRRCSTSSPRSGSSASRAGRPAPYVLTSLGQQVVDRESWTDAAVPLEDVERLRTDLLSTIAHELRTPLTVDADEHRPAARPGLPADRRAAHGDARDHRAQRRADAAASSATSSTSPGSGPGTIRLQLRRFDATDLAASSVGRRPAAGRPARPDARVDAPAGAGPHVFGDRPRLERALLNLVANALRFSPDGGSRGPRPRIRRRG